MDIPDVSIVTCGPTEQREEFENRFNSPVDVTSFTVPPFDPGELTEFVDWFSERTGRPVETEGLTRENTLLVQLVFEMAEGMPLYEFSRRFRHRLELGDVLRPVQRILALNALYIEAPVTILSELNARDVLGRLSALDQKHFHLTSDAIVFAHPHLAGEILAPILRASYPNLPWEIAWGRELLPFMESAVQDDVIPRRILFSLNVTKHLSPSERNRVLRDLYERHIEINAGTCSSLLLPRWLESMHRFQDLLLLPSPLDYAISQMRVNAPSVHHSVAHWVWLMAERTGLPISDVDHICWHFLLSKCGTPGSAQIAAWFLAQCLEPDTRRARAVEWLRKNTDETGVAVMLQVLIARDAKEPQVWKAAAEYLEKHWNERHASGLLRAVIARTPEEELEKWVTKGLEYLQLPQCSDRAGILGQLLVRSRARPAILDLAVAFVLSEEPKKYRDQVLFDLARACRFNLRNAFAYLDSCAESHRPEVARAVAFGVKRYPERLEHFPRILLRYTPTSAFAVLGQILKVGCTIPDLDALLLRVLQEHSGQDGYLFLLKMLRRRTDVWDRLCLALDPSVVTDYEALSKTDDLTG
jgi:hypothetical protein